MKLILLPEEAAAEPAATTMIGGEEESETHTTPMMIEGEEQTAGRTMVEEADTNEEVAMTAMGTIHAAVIVATMNTMIEGMTTAEEVATATVTVRGNMAAAALKVGSTLATVAQAPGIMVAVRDTLLRTEATRVTTARAGVPLGKAMVVAGAIAVRAVIAAALAVVALVAMAVEALVLAIVTTEGVVVVATVMQVRAMAPLRAAVGLMVVVEDMAPAIPTAGMEAAAVGTAAAVLTGDIHHSPRPGMVLNLAGHHPHLTAVNLDMEGSRRPRLGKEVTGRVTADPDSQEQAIVHTRLSFCPRKGGYGAQKIPTGLLD